MRPWLNPLNFACQVINKSKTEIKHKSLILAQIERWRQALHMQVER